jgi:hypothetical protein
VVISEANKSSVQFEPRLIVTPLLSRDILVPELEECKLLPLAYFSAKYRYPKVDGARVRRKKSGKAEKKVNAARLKA